jgi:hypothetical protein
MKIVVNRCFGGFSISKKAAEYMANIGSKQAAVELEENKSRWYGYGYVDGFDDGYERNDKHLVAAVEALGDEANGASASLEVVEIPDDVDWEIDEYDGREMIREKSRTW